MIRIACFKWAGRRRRASTNFTADHVNRFASMVDRHMNDPCEIVCVTDDPTGIDGSVRIVPLWDDLPHADFVDRCWRRLKAFDESMADLIGPRFVWFDLDTVITGNITSLLQTDADFQMWRSVTPRRSPYNGSMVLMNAGARQGVWTEFDYERAVAEIQRRNLIGTDQAWIAVCLGPDERVWTSKDGVLSFRFDLAPLWYRNRLERCQQTIPLRPDARIVFFHGEYDPSMAVVQDRCPWVADHWR